MADSFTDLLRIRQQENGGNSTTWGTLANASFNMLEEAIAGRAAVTHDNTANYSLTTANDTTDESRNAILNIAGALTAARNTVCPTSSKVYIAKNATTGGYATTLKTTAGTGISIPNGKTMLLFCDGTNVVEGIDYITTLQVGTLTLTNPVGPASGGTGVANNAASTITISGAYALTLTLSNTTSVTLPTTGTLATLAGAEELDNKTLDSSVGKGTWTASGTWTLPAVTLGGAVTVPTGVTVTGAGTAAITGFTSVSATTLAGTLSTATQNSVTTMTGLVTVGALNSGSITSGFGSIDVGADAISGGAGTFRDGNISISVGADSGATTLTDATTKVARWTTPHYTNAEAPVGFAVVANANGTNTITIGGGSSTVNAATTINFNTGATSTTVAGTTRLSIDSAGAIDTNNGSLSTGSGAISGGAISGTTLSTTDIASIIKSGSDYQLRIGTTAATWIWEFGRINATGAFSLRHYYNAVAASPSLTIAQTADGTAGAVTIPGTLGVTGMTYINDTSNANMTTGLTINQGAATDEALALKSSDVDHGMTVLAETDTYANIKKHNATAGGAAFRGFTEGTTAILLSGVATTGDTTKSTAGIAAVTVVASKKNGTTSQVMGADENLFSIQNGTTARFIFDAEGSAHADVEWVAFDHHDDITLLNGLNAEMQRRKGVVQVNFGEWVRDSRDALQREGIFNFYDDGPRAMMNMTKMHMLEVGAIRQLARQGGNVEARLEVIERKLLQ